MMNSVVSEWAGGEAGGNRWRTPLLISIGVLLGVSVFGVFTWMLCKKSSMLREIQQGTISILEI
jgi:hypothetical protein